MVHNGSMKHRSAMVNQADTLKSISINGVKMYTASSKSVPTWVAPQKNKVKEKNYNQKLEILQDLSFKTATTKIKATPDGEYIIASGIYPPQVKVYELRELALKFERHLDSEIVDFQVLDDDYSKLAFLCADRSIYLHAKYGKHYSLRIPRVGRDLEYDSWSCDLLCAGSSPELVRINLAQGQFLSSLPTQSPALNVVCRSKIHGLVACGGEDGAVECFDMRTKSSVGRINVARTTGDINEEVTALEFDGDGGFLMGVGSSGGKVLLYDLRSSHPIRVKDHMYGSAILDIKWHQTLNSERAKLITTDSHVVRIWDPETGDGMTSIEPAGEKKINDICVVKNSGLVLLALDHTQIPSFYIPALGPAPRWCSHLENLTEEMEEDPETTIYDNFKFLTKDELEKFGLTHLIGTDVLRAYMHGFFVDYRLYKKALADSTPFDYDSYMEQRKKDKLEAERASRITIKRKLPKVNRDFAAGIFDNEEAEIEKKEADHAETKKKFKPKKGITSDDLKDERFAEMFENTEFEIDKFSEEYRSLHPMAKTQSSLVGEHFEPVTEDVELSSSDSESSAEGSDGDNNRVKKKARGPRLFEVKDERHADAFQNRVSLAKENALSMGERVAALQDDRRRVLSNVKFGPGGSREISFSSRRTSKYKEDDDDELPRHDKRGVQSLGFKPDKSGFRGRGGRGRGSGSGRGGGRGHGSGARGRGSGGNRGRGRRGRH